MEERFETFTVQLATISRLIRKIKTEEMAERNLKGPHVSCLYYIYKSGSLTAKELCDICSEDKAAISRSLEYLEENGYVACASGAKKRYKAELTLTEKGKSVGAYIAEKVDAVVEQAGEGLTEAERAILYKSLALIGNNLQKICEKYGG